MKHEFETTKTTKNINDLLPATDEELGLELLEFSEDMMLKGMGIALKKRKNVKKIFTITGLDKIFKVEG